MLLENPATWNTDCSSASCGCCGRRQDHCVGARELVQANLNLSRGRACGCTTSEGRSSQNASVTAPSLCSLPTVTSAMAGTQPPSADSTRYQPPPTHPPLPCGPLLRGACPWDAESFLLPSLLIGVCTDNLEMLHLGFLCALLSYCDLLEPPRRTDAASDRSTFDLWVPVSCLCAQMLR